METKKYRLKSLYPGLTALIKEGDTVKQDVCGNYLVKDTVIFINRYDVEDYPDFWEEIIERTPIRTIIESPDPKQPKHDYEGALKYVMANIINNNPCETDAIYLLSQLREKFEIFLSFKAL